MNRLGGLVLNLFIDYYLLIRVLKCFKDIYSNCWLFTEELRQSRQSISIITGISNFPTLSASSPFLRSSSLDFQTLSPPKQQVFCWFALLLRTLTWPFAHPWEGQLRRGWLGWISWDWLALFSLQSLLTLDPSWPKWTILRWWWHWDLPKCQRLIGFKTSWQVILLNLSVSNNT